MRWRVVPAVPVRLLDDVVLVPGTESAGVGDRPAEAGELARDGDGDQGAAVAAVGGRGRRQVRVAGAAVRARRSL